jgi:RHS repeat-associated protein
MRLETLAATAPDSSSILNYGYPEYDEVGNIITKTTEHGNYAYDYDPSSRLISADNPALDDEAYTYDDVGNRLTSAGVAGTWDYNLNNELLGYADVAYDYDANGNLTEIRIAGSPVWTYTYDVANRLIHAEDGTGSISADYYYDPFGRRLWKEIGGERTFYFYADEGLVGEYNATGATLRSYGYEPGSTASTSPIFTKVGSTYYYFLNDRLGKPLKMIDTAGAVVWSAAYDEYGQAEVDAGAAIVNNFRLPGQYHDAESGLHYNYHRYYDPTIGRYLRADPIGLEGGVNLFIYTLNNPINLVDIYGQDIFNRKKET